MYPKLPTDEPPSYNEAVLQQNHIQPSAPQLPTSLPTQNRSSLNPTTKNGNSKQKYFIFMIIAIIIIIISILTTIIFSILWGKSIQDQGNTIIIITSKTTEFVTIELETTKLTFLSIPIQASSTPTRPSTPSLTTTQTTPQPPQLDYESVFNNIIFVEEKKRKISFHKHKILDLKFLFKAVHWKYKDKHFKQLKIENEFIESIDENVLGKIRFDGIQIQDCPKLNQIHWNAFGQQTKYIRQFEFWDELPNLQLNLNADYNLIRLINSLFGCKEIWIKPFDIMNSIKLDKLESLHLYGKNSLIKLQSINDYTFYGLKLKRLI